MTVQPALSESRSHARQGMARWVGGVVRRRRLVFLVWLVLVVLGGTATSHLGSLLSNQFTIPNSDSQRGLDLLRRTMDERSDGAFTLVVKAAPSTAPATLRATAEAAATRVAATTRGAKAGLVERASRSVAFVQITTPLQNAKASDRTPLLRRAIGHPAGVSTYLSGFPAVNHDTQPLYSRDLTQGEAIAGPIAIVVLIFMFGTLVALGIPIVFAIATIPVTLGGVWIFAHWMNMAVYVENVVELIGLAIAIDYSMLVVFRFREQLQAGDDPERALETTMATAGRATLFSGLTVAIGLALLVVLPIPFIRSMGVGGVMIPLVSIAACMTLLPALLSLAGARVNRLRVVPRRLLARRATAEGGFWAALASSIMRRPVLYFAASLAVMLVLAYPATQLKVTAGDNRGIPPTTEATKGLKLLEDTVGPGALAPNQVVVDTGRPGGAFAPTSLAAQRRLIAELSADHEITPSSIAAPTLLAGRLPPAQAQVAARRINLVDARARVYQVRADGRHDSGTTQAMDLVNRIRKRYLPAARIPGRALLTGAPAFGVDFVNRAYGVFPWLVVAVLVISYLLLMRAFRSLFLPLKAVFMNLLSVAASYGVLVMTFEHGWGTAVGLQSSPQIEGWIPIFLFAILFGLSMDYEVFLLTRMREEWDTHGENERAVAYGLEHTGRIITAAALIMIAAFSGFTSGHFVGLQEFGVGLSVAILLDATIVRAILVPATMKLVGHWNWYLPQPVQRALRLPRPAVTAPARTLERSA